MDWDVEGTDEFGAWFASLSDDEGKSVAAGIDLLVQHGPSLRFPKSSGVNGSRHSHLRELRIQHHGRPFRVFYAFDPRRVAIVLLDGDNTGDDRFYERLIPKADRLYDDHLAELRREGLIT